MSAEEIRRKACSFRGHGTGASGKDPRNGIWQTSTTVSGFKRRVVAVSGLWECDSVFAVSERVVWENGNVLMFLGEF